MGKLDDAEFVLRVIIEKLAPNEEELTAPCLASLTLVLLERRKNFEAESLAAVALSRLEAINPKSNIEMLFTLELISRRRYLSDHYRAILTVEQYKIFEETLIDTLEMSKLKKVNQRDIDQTLILGPETIEIIKFIQQLARKQMLAVRPTMDAGSSEFSLLCTNYSINAYKTILCIEPVNTEAVFCLAVLYRDLYVDHNVPDAINFAKDYALQFVNFSKTKEEMIFEDTSLDVELRANLHSELLSHREFMSEIIKS